MINNFEKCFNKVKELYERKNFDRDYKICLNNSVNVKYSIGGEGTFYGVYPQEPLMEAIVTNMNNGKLVKNIDKGYNFKYYFDQFNNLILIEHYNEFGLHHVSCFNHNSDNNTIEIIDYSSGETICDGVFRVAFSERNIDGQIIKFIDGDYQNDDCFYIKEYIYEYTNNSTKVTEIKYIKFLRQDIKITNEEFNFNKILKLKVPDENKKVKKIDDNLIFELLYNDIKNVVEKWKVEECYAVSIILIGNNIYLDYNEEKDVLDKQDLEKRWNYAYWNQHEVELLNESKDIINEWLEYLDYKTGKYYSIKALIDNSRFIKILQQVIIKLREEKFFLKLHNNDVAVIIHNLEYWNELASIAKKINDSEVIKPFVDWINEMYR